MAGIGQRIPAFEHMRDQSEYCYVVRANVIKTDRLESSEVSKLDVDLYQYKTYREI